MVEIVRSATFDRWLSGLRDIKGRAIVLVRIERLAAGNPGDVKAIGGGLSEMRISFGPGYRIYFMQRGTTFVVLLAGGNKTTQTRDIAHARSIASEWKD